MVDSARKRVLLHRPASDQEVPDDIARALDASSEDVRLDRTADIGDFLRNMDARLEAHRAGKAARKR